MEMSYIDVMKYYDAKYAKVMKTEFNSKNKETVYGSGMYKMGWFFFGHYIESGQVDESLVTKLIRESREIGLESSETY